MKREFFWRQNETAVFFSDLPRSVFRDTVGYEKHDEQHALRGAHSVYATAHILFIFFSHSITCFSTKVPIMTVSGRLW